MHTDEAVHAIKFGALLEQNNYRYDPIEYHGPTLNYLTLIPARLSCAQNLTEINEFTLRIVPVCAGILLVLAVFFLVDGLTLPVALLSALLAAISPAMVFYSRYYIMEILLVFFTFGAIISGYRYVKKPQIMWAILTGLFLGLMHATKETCIITYGSFVLALVFSQWNNSLFKNVKKLNLLHFLVVIVAGLFVSALFFSSFFTNPKGILDSFLTYSTYLNRAGHNDWHIHPWYYYIKLLVYFKNPGPLFSEAFIVLFAVYGAIVSIRYKDPGGADKGLVRFIAFYSIIMALIYSAIPYKTPWSMLGFFHGFILLAAIGIVTFLKNINNKRLKTISLIVLFAGFSHLGWQTILLNFKYEANPSNPYVYAHPVKDVIDIAKRIDEYSLVHPQGKNMFIEVICPGGDYWPLPWYLRAYPNIGWWNAVDMNISPGSIIIASPKVEPDILTKLYELPPPGEKNLYLPLFDTVTELRPHIELRGYVVKDLWDSYMQNQ